MRVLNIFTLIVVVPKQRYFYYTLDEHIHFFMNKYAICHLFDVPVDQVELYDGDWLIRWSPEFTNA